MVVCVDNGVDPVAQSEFVLNHFMQDGPLPASDASEIRSRGRFESTPALNQHMPEEVGS